MNLCASKPFTYLCNMIDEKKAISEKVVLIAVVSQLQNEEKTKEYLDQYFALETDVAKKVKILSDFGNEAAKKGQKSKQQNKYSESVLK